LFEANYHTHTTFGDGLAGPEEFIKAALELGFKAIGFSEHSPVPFLNTWSMKEEKLSDYCNTIKELKEKYKSSIEVYLSLEIDYIKGLTGPKSPKYQMLGLDYIIGAVHYMKMPGRDIYLNVDGNKRKVEELMNEGYGGDIKKVVGRYYENVREMVETQTPDIVAHLDIIKKNNGDNSLYQDDSKWYRNEVVETLEIIAGKGCIVEINTGGISRGKTTSAYQGMWELKECNKHGIPVTLNSDAHSPEYLDAYFKEAVQWLLEAGYSSYLTFRNGKWKETSIVA
jgi:histidinol-phosphatase (PHP family)